MLDWQAMRLRVCPRSGMLLLAISGAVRCHRLVRSYPSFAGGTEKGMTVEHDTGSWPVD